MEGSILNLKPTRNCTSQFCRVTNYYKVWLVLVHNCIIFVFIYSQVANNSERSQFQNILQPNDLEIHGLFKHDNEMTMRTEQSDREKLQYETYKEARFCRKEQEHQRL